MSETLDYQSRSTEDRRQALLDVFIRIILWRRKTAIDFNTVDNEDVLIDLLTSPIVDTTSLFHSMHIIIIFVYNHIQFFLLTHLCVVYECIFVSLTSFVALGPFISGFC